MKINAFPYCSLCRVLEILARSWSKKRRRPCVERSSDWNNSCNRWPFHMTMLDVNKPGRTIHPLTRRYCKLSVLNWKSKWIPKSEISTPSKTFLKICWSSWFISHESPALHLYKLRRSRSFDKAQCHYESFAALSVWQIVISAHTTARMWAFLYNSQ